MQAPIPGLTQATPENPIECTIAGVTVPVRWTPPGEAWPRARIESIKIAPSLMRWVHEPDAGDLSLLRVMLKRTSDTLAGRESSGDLRDRQIIRDRVAFLQAWINVFERAEPGRRRRDFSEPDPAAERAQRACPDESDDAMRD